jgi:hypothetical protein
MVDPATVSNWALTILKWVKELPIISGLLKPRSLYPDVSIVPKRTMYHEATQKDGSIVTQIEMDCLVTNGSEDRSLIIARSECYVWRYGTVQGVVFANAIPPRDSAEVRFVFLFSKSLGKPRRCKMLLLDQFDKRHTKWVRLHYGRPHDPF